MVVHETSFFLRGVHQATYASFKYKLALLIQHSWRNLGPVRLVLKLADKPAEVVLL